ncbi:MAG TPA: hypothetical protein VMV29_07350, partial [Ktedonobacterales bacterium]|nr:hypothetical protein [Ktedonobacterales bacterium]
YGAVGNNPAHDDTAGVNAALAVGTTVIPPGVTFYISAPLTMTVAGSELFGLGRGTSQIKQMATFSGAALITISADFCSVRDLTLLGSSSSSSGASVAATGITLAGARYCSLRNLEGYYLNGYLIEAAVTGTVTNQGAIIEDIHLLHCNGGIHVLSSAALNNIGQVWMSNLNLEIADGPLDAVLIEEANDIQISNYGGAAGQGSNTNSALHIKGSCASVTVLNPDIGVFPGPASAPTMLVESTVNGAPSRITVMGGVIQAGTYCVQATNGTNFLMSGVQFRAWTVIGLSLELAGAMYASIVGCEFSSASTTGSSGRYDLNIASSSARVTVANCIFRDTIGTGAGQVNASLNTAGGRVYLLGNDFEGATLANAFQGGVLPGLLVNNANINPAGSVSVTVGASPYSVPTKPYPVTYYISGGTVTSLAVGGVTLTGITSGPIRVPPQTAFTITHSGAPTVVGFGD